MFRCGFLHLEVQGLRGLGVKGLGCRVFFVCFFFEFVQDVCMLLCVLEQGFSSNHLRRALLR